MVSGRYDAMSEKIISLILLVLLLYGIGKVVKWIFGKLARLAAWINHIFSGGPAPKTNRRPRSSYRTSGAPVGGMTYSDLYWKLDAWNEDDEDCDPDDYDYTGDDLFEEITDRARRVTGRRPDMKDPVPEWVTEEYAEWL